MIRPLLLAAVAAGALAAALPAPPARALQAPRPGRADAHMRWVDYDPAQVYRVVGAPRTATEIVLGPDETILHVALGDSAAWDVAAEKNILFIKPRQKLATTNLIVTTRRGEETRNYTFELTARPTGRATASYYQVRFRYPADQRARAVAVISAEAAALERKIVELKLDRGVVEGQRNLHYTVQGASALQPSEVSDNGRFTLLRFPASQAVPAIYAVTADGTESLVPFDVRGEFVVVHSVERQLRLRRGRDVLCIWNDAYDPYGASLGTGTAAADVDRTSNSEP